MKIAQYYDRNKIRIGLIEKNSLIPVHFEGEMIDLIRQGIACEPSGDPLHIEDIRFAPVLSRPSKIIGIGLNYLDHIEEGSATVPDTPMVFTKFQSCLTGHRGEIIWNSSLTKKVDFEAELAVVIGKSLHDCPEEKAMDNIFGYTCANDVSARDIQFTDGQWVRGKSLDTFCPLGPWIVTSDDIEDPHSLNIRSILNGDIMQDSNTGLMLFKVPQLISFLSKNFTLLPGDVILTGTPHGVGCFREPPLFMGDGDEIIVEIENIGKLQNICRVY